MSLIIGDRTDPHVQAVIAAMEVEPAVIDAATVLTAGVTFTAETLAILGQEIRPRGAWLRRLAPEGWISNLESSDLESVTRSAAVSALASIARDDRFAWLTSLECLGSAENKPHQYRVAARVGAPVPQWIVTTDANAVPQSGEWIAKALGPGSFIDEKGRGRVVPTRLVDTSDRETIARVPFILQRLVGAAAHARIVTVGSNAWSATLPAMNLPIDWRSSPAGHFGFGPSPAPHRVHDLALAIAANLRVGYSSQDWIEDSSGEWWFVDLNPAGQWLFLPEEVTLAVTGSIASHLDGAG